MEFLGEYRGSGCREAPWLLRRPDGGVLSVSPLLYSLASAIDGRLDTPALAQRLTVHLGRTVSAANVEFLIDHKLAPLGLVVGQDGRQGDEGPRALGLRLRRAVLPRSFVEGAAAALSPLFRPLAVATILGGVCAFDAWLFMGHGIRHGVTAVGSGPGAMMLTYALLVLSGLFHELGHAAGGRYGGARPGRVGFGLYVIWPAFFSDMTDSYRLDRAGRLRTDLGGIYFNAVFILGCAAAYWATGARAILVSIVLQHVLVACQLVPFLRLDGYYILSDLLGVPDLFARMRPLLRRLLARRHHALATDDLKRWARALVMAWVMVTAALMSVAVVMLVHRAPDVVTAVLGNVARQAAILATGVDRGDVADCLVAAFHLTLASLIPLGLGLTLVSVLRRAVAASLASGQGRSAR